jgi:hypothetical protein
MVRVVSVLALWCGLCAAQGTDPKQKSSDYSVQVEVGDADIGMEYMVRTLSHRANSIYVDDYLLVEVAVFPPENRKILVRATDFNLRVNGKKSLLHPQTPGMVAASLKYPDWAQTRELTATAGVGDRGIIIGRPHAVGRFPGDPRPGATGRIPPAPKTPDPVPKREESLDLNDLVSSAALPEGEMRFPVSGYLFFAWPDKLSKIRKVELLIRTSSGDTVVARLR